MRKYHGKLLIAGEYTIIDGGDGLLLPLDRFNGVFEFADDKEIDESLLNFANALKDNPPLNSILDCEKFLLDVNKGLSFKSNIPQGFGVGSSGALTAAVYDRYAYAKEENLLKLKHILADIESHFHGKSSGLDALVSYVDKALYINETSIIPWDVDNNIVRDFYLFESNSSRNTQKYVNYFLENIKPKSENKNQIVELAFHNKQLIKGILENDSEKVMAAMKIISRIQFELFEYMIIDEVRDDWEYGLNSGDYYFKLCGAGGGGYYLCYDVNGWLMNPDNILSIKQ